MNVTSQKNVRPTSLAGVSLTAIFCRASVTPERAKAASSLRSLMIRTTSSFDEPGQAEADDEDDDPGEEAGQEGHELLGDLPQRLDEDLVEEALHGDLLGERGSGLPFHLSIEIAFLPLEGQAELLEPPFDLLGAAVPGLDDERGDLAEVERRERLDEVLPAHRSSGDRPGRSS